MNANNFKLIRNIPKIFNLNTRRKVDKITLIIFVTVYYQSKAYQSKANQSEFELYSKDTSYSNCSYPIPNRRLGTRIFVLLEAIVQHDN